MILRQLTSVLSLYSLLVISLFVLPWQKKGVLSDDILFPQWQKFMLERARTLVNSTHHPALAQVFLTNEKHLDLADINLLQTSGLMHLLAISGAQMLPLASGAAALIGFFLYLSLRRVLPVPILMPLLAWLRWICAATLATVIACLFGWSGALLRVLVLHYGSQVSWVRSLVTGPLAKAWPHAYWQCVSLTPTLTRSFLILVMSGLWGNVFANLSFLLSATGAACAQLCVIFLSKNMWPSVWSRWWIQGPSLAVCVSAMMNVVLWPVTSSFFWASCMANLFAVTLVSLVVTPVSLFLLFVPIAGQLQHGSMWIFDQGLGAFSYVSHAFGSALPIENSFWSLFSSQGRAYLSVILIFFWSIADFIATQKIFQIKPNLENKQV